MADKELLKRMFAAPAGVRVEPLPMPIGDRIVAWLRMIAKRLKLRKLLTFRGLGNMIIASIVWGIGVFFTHTLLPFRGLDDRALWGVAVLLQVALTLGQTNLRDGHLSWAYLVLVLIDVLLNLLGLLMQFEVTRAPMESVLYLLHAATTGANLWIAIGLGILAALIAALPEQMFRDM